MKTLLLLISLSAALAAQTTLTLSGPATARPGQSIDLVLSLAAPGPRPAGLQWTLELPAGATAAAQAGAAAVAAEKTLYCSEQATLCLLVALNQTTMAPGEVGKYTVTVPSTAAKGLYQIPLSGVMAASAQAVAQPIASGPVYEIRVLARSDINGDGVTNMADLQLILDQVFGRAPCSDDQNGDGRCDLLDVLLVVRGALDQ